MQIIAIIITIVNLISLLFIFLKFRRNKYQDMVVEKLKKEVSLLITELNRVTERNITLIEDSIDKSVNNKSVNKKRKSLKNNEKISRILPINSDSENKKQHLSTAKNKVEVVNADKSKLDTSMKYLSEKSVDENNAKFNSFYQRNSHNIYNKFTNKINVINIKDKGN